MVRINKVYTKAGDAGRTQLVGGDKVPKSDLRIECYGTIDELNAHLGHFAALVEESKVALDLVPVLQRIQNELFNVGTQIATPDPERRATYPDISVSNIAAMEKEIDGWNEALPDLQSFVLPGGSRASAAAHLSRTVCRRAERLVVALHAEADVDAKHLSYLNRLSDALFVMGRYSLVKEGREEFLWKPEDV